MLELDTALEPVEKRIKRTVLRLQCGDFTNLPVDAIVYYAGEDLALTAGFGHLIQMRGGPAVSRELAAIGRLALGKAVVTTGGNLRPRRIIHACGPRFAESGFEDKYRECIHSAVSLADVLHIRTLAFPVMGAGFYGLSLKLAADWMLSSIRSALHAGTQLCEIIICVTDRREFEVVKEALDRSCEESA